MIDITRHAGERIMEMGIADSELVDAILDPVIRYPSGPPYDPDCITHLRGQIAVVVRMEHDRAVIITVLWWTQDQYVRIEKES